MDPPASAQTEAWRAGRRTTEIYSCGFATTRGFQIFIRRSQMQKIKQYCCHEDIPSLGKSCCVTEMIGIRNTLDKLSFALISECFDFLYGNEITGMSFTGGLMHLDPELSW